MSLRRLATFLLLAFGLSWAYWGWMAATGRVAAPGSTASHLPGLLGPALAAIVTTAIFDSHGGLAKLWRSALTVPRRKLWAATAIVLPPLAALVLLAATGPLPARAAVFSYPGVVAGTPALATVLIVLVLNGFGEELGWRGFLLPALMDRLRPATATAAVAAIWALWHLPLFWVNASMAALVGPALIGWLIGLGLGAFALAHLWRFTGGSVLATALWHTSYNFAVATEATAGLPAAVISTLVMVWGAAVAFWWWRHPD